MNNKDLINAVAEGLLHLAPLPNNTPLQKLINKLYMQLRVIGMPLSQINDTINQLLEDHGISKEKLLNKTKL